MKTGTIFLCLMIFIISSNDLISQISSNIVKFDKIGDTLDANERIKYNLFPELNGFQYAVFFSNPDNILTAKICLHMDGQQKDTIIKKCYTQQLLTKHILITEEILEDPEYEIFSNRKDMITISLFNKEKIVGELLTIGDSSLLIYPVKVSNLTDLESIKMYSRKINLKDIEGISIRFKSKSYALIGTSLGLLGGAGIGAIIGNIAYESKSKHQMFDDLIVPLNTLGGAIIGTVSGLIIGAIASPSGEITLYSPTKYDFSLLKMYAKYENFPIYKGGSREILK